MERTLKPGPQKFTDKVNYEIKIKNPKALRENKSAYMTDTQTEHNHIRLTMTGNNYTDYI